MQKIDNSLIISHIAYPVTALGPGYRIVIWVAGCPLQCKECITPQLQDPDNGKLINIDKLVTKLLSIQKKVDQPISGISLTGGEPFVQSAQLALMWQKIKKIHPEWNLLVFSGYQYAQLCSKAEAGKLLKMTDILIDGPYLPDLAPKTSLENKHPLLASANQYVHYLSNTGKLLQAQCQSLPCQSANLGISKSDTAWLIGILDKKNRTKIHQQFKNYSPEPVETRNHRGNNQ